MSELPDRLQTRRYTFKLYPTREQADLLHEHRRMMADLWNALKERYEEVHRRTRGQRGVVHADGKHVLSRFDMTRELTDLRREYPEWRAIACEPARQVARHLTEAYSAFFRRLKELSDPDLYARLADDFQRRTGRRPTRYELAGYPRWRSYRHATTISLGTMGETGWRIEQRSDNPFSWLLHYGPITDVRDRSTWMHTRGRIPDDAVTTGSPDSEIARPIGVRRHHRAENAVQVVDWRNADIMWRDERWWISVCVVIAPRRNTHLNGVPRSQGSITGWPMHVSFDLIDDFVRVNGVAETPDGLLAARLLDDDRSRLQEALNERWPLGRARGDEDREALREARREVARLSARIARIRKNALHVWTARLVERADDITIVAPRVRESTRTPRGNAQFWGANVEAALMVNRSALSMAPSMTIQMLRYKAEEKGIRCEVVEDASPNIAVGMDMVQAGVTLRRERRIIKKAA